MPKYQCNSCGATYSDTMAGGTPYFHVCSAEVIDHAEFDGRGHQTKPETRTPRPDIRDERPPAGIIWDTGKAYVLTPVPGENGVFTLEPATSLVISEGKGRALIG